LLLIDHYAYVNRLSRVHPAEKIILALATLLQCLLSSSPVTPLLAALLMAGLVIAPAKIPPAYYARLMLVPAAFLLPGALAVAVCTVEDIQSLLWGVQLGGRAAGVTAGSLAAAAAVLLKSLGAVSCLYFLVLTTPVADVCAVLGRLGLPALLLEIMTMMYRFIFVLLATARRIYTAQASRLGYSRVKSSFYSLGRLATGLFTKSLYHSEMLYLSLSARCYAGKIAAPPVSRPLSARNMALIAAVQLALLAAALWPGGAGR